ncbi:MAG: fatty acyl-AMP ligase [Microcoleaceae cyanobacterium]
MSLNSIHSSPTLVHLLRDRAQTLPDQQAYTFLPDGETESGNLTYGQLDQQARQLAAYLQSLHAFGVRALVVYPYTAGLEFIATFFGCLYAGVIAVTCNPPHSSQEIDKILDRLASSQATVALTNQALLTQLQGLMAKRPELANSFSRVSWIATDTLLSPSAESGSEHWAENWAEPNVTPDTLAFLQYTSGSTGTPKGVKVTHKNVLHNSALIYQCFGHSAHSQGVMWLPLFHDMGLIGGVIQPLYGGFPVTLMSPVALIQKPFRWLQAVSKYRATTSGGPNFAYDLACRQVTLEQLHTLDLKTWDLAFSGAEPVRAETLERFTQTFAPCGFRSEAFYPCYGMAEATLFISGGIKAEQPVVQVVDGGMLEQNQGVEVAPDHPQARQLVGCGQGWLGDEMVIVNPDVNLGGFIPCAENQVGEIWFRGSGVGQGYWNQPEETEQMFQAYLGERGPFLRTGDLGFLRNGELFITGRIKDMMILWGRNRYPQDIEKTVEHCHPALRSGCGAAFSIEAEGEERLVIAYEVERQMLKRLNVPECVAEVVATIRQAVAEQHTVDVYAIALLKTGTIPKTSSGKIQRRACRAQFLQQALNLVAQWQLSEESSSLVELANQV